ncbi:MAG TPA: SemiSWEET family transporter [Actinomycetota bacterium]
MSETVLGVVTAGWAIVMALAPMLQIRRILRRRSSRDVSIGYLAVLVVGFCLWISYGTVIGNLVLIVPNTLALLTGVAAIAVALRFR